MSRKKNRRHDRESDSYFPSATPTANPEVLSAENSGSRISATRQMNLVHQSEFYSGPLPAPAHLKAYEDIVPGLADRIVSMAEAQSKHRQDLELRVIKSDCRRSWGGLVAGLFVAVVGLGFGAFTICQGHDVAGAAIAGTTLVSLVGSFLYGTWSQKNERLRKIKISSPNEEKKSVD